MLKSIHCFDVFGRYGMIAPLLLWHLARMVGFVLGALLIAHFIRQRRPPSGSIPWMLALILCPYLALPLYLMFGGRKLRAIALRKRRLEF
jgi:cardiolipin synthase